MTQTATVKALLSVENSGAEVLFEQLQGTSAYIWPLARWPIARALAQTESKLELRGTAPASKLQILNRVARLALPNPQSSDRIEPTEHLFVVSGTTRGDADRGTGNWLSDAFAQALGSRAAVVQDASFDILTPRAQRPANPRTWTYSQASARIWRASQERPLDSDQRAHARLVLSGIFDLFGAALSPGLRERLLGQIIPLLERAPHAESEFVSLLDRVSPRRIYLQMAAYGDRSNLIRIAHARGIAVSELQHGWIGPAHAAYNFGRAFQSTDLASSLPDTLLTFGTYWGKDLKFPGRIVPVGKPSLERAASDANALSTREARLLVVSSEYETQRLIDAAIILRRSLPASWKVAVRPHPAERPAAVKLFERALEHGVELDPILDLNASLLASRAVVGMTSTVLFEALAFGVTVGVVETDLAKHYASADAFPNRLHEEESFIAFVEKLENPPVSRQIGVDDIWQPEAVAAFLAEANAE